MPQEIDRHRLQRLQARGAAILEVLPNEEYLNEHISGAANLPLDDLSPSSVERLIGKDRRRAIVTYCQSVA
jgi:rhodanese-related sulfurtransferase